MSQSMHHSVIDELLDAYLDWRQQSTDVQSAYRRWNDAPKADSALAYAAYKGALDREQRASECYAEMIRNTSHLSAEELERAMGYRQAA
jgi:hypothetical protein